LILLFESVVAANCGSWCVDPLCGTIEEGMHLPLPSSSHGSLVLPFCYAVAKVMQGCYELKQHKLWFNKGCSELLKLWKQARFVGVQDLSRMKEISHEQHKIS
jgi:hypothetical protein